MIINNNLNAMQAHRNNKSKQVALSKDAEKLSSGLRINRSSDDAAGLSISEKMRAQIRGMDQASRNAQDGISLVQTAEGAMQEIQQSIHRIRELWVQRGNDTYTEDDKIQIDEEAIQLLDLVNEISLNTKFNTKGLIDGSSTNINLQIGANANEHVNFKINSIDTMYLVGVIDTTLISRTPLIDDSEINLDILDVAITRVSTERSMVGALQNRLEHTIMNLNNASENTQAAESRIRDVDMAKVMMNYSKESILINSSQAMLAQANQQPQTILQLLK